MADNTTNTSSKPRGTRCWKLLLRQTSPFYVARDKWRAQHADAPA